MKNNKISQKGSGLMILFILLCTSQMSSYSSDSIDYTMELSSPVFDEDGTIPVKYTCDGANISPPLKWSAGPEGTVTYAIICDDPDAPVKTWVHWVVFNLPAGLDSLPEHIPPVEILPDSSMQGRNDSRKIGYSGPCPPRGIHRYYFKVYAVDKKLDNKPGITKSELLKAMEGHILSEGQLMGKYKRQ